MSIAWIKVFLTINGIYDGLLGAAFFIAPRAIYGLCAVAPPNHYGYVRFPALLLVIFGVMFLRAAADPVARRDALLYGMALKASYFGLVFWYDLRGGVPSMWIPFAWADLLFFILFLIAWRSISRNSGTNGRATS